MPFDFDALPTFEPVQPEKLPTLRQYLKTVGKKKIPDSFPVFLIWLPGKFENYTFQTERFRAQVPKGTPLYGLITHLLSECEINEKTFAISIVDREAATFKIVPCNEQGVWEYIGESGLKFTQS